MPTSETQKVTLRCRICHRVEDILGDQTKVVTEGGLRKPVEHPELSAMRVVALAAAGECGPVCKSCSACGQPMVCVQGPGGAIPWTFQLKGQAVVCPAGECDEQVQSQVIEEYKTTWFSELRPGKLLFETTLLSFMTFPFMLWLGAVFTVVWFIYNFPYSPDTYAP